MILKENKFNYIDLLRLLFVGFSGLIFGNTFQLYLRNNHPSYNNDYSYLFMICFLIIFIVFWIITPSIMFGKELISYKKLDFIRKDFITYVFFDFLYFYKFPIIINNWMYFIVFLLFFVSKYFLFKKYINIFINRFENFVFFLLKLPILVFNFILKINNNMKILNSNKTKILDKVYFLLKILIVMYCFLICVSKMNEIYSVPLNKPYYTGSWDEPFGINAGINIIHTNGDPCFYNYGGTTSWVYGLSFLIYSSIYNIKPCYKFFGEQFFLPNFPIFRNIYPTKPIYISNIIFIVLFFLFSFLFISLFTWFLLPFPCLIFQSINFSNTLQEYKSFFLGNIEVTFFSGMTIIFFLLSILEKHDFKKYFKYLLICCFFASISIASKISCAYIVFLPIALIIYMYKNFDRVTIVENKFFLKCVLVLIIPYLIINPGILLNTSSYFSWLKNRARQGSVVPFSWMEVSRLENMLIFIKSLYFIKVIPNFFIIIFFILSSILLINASPIIFGSFMFFLFYSFQIILNLHSDFPYSRLYSFLLFPISLFLLFPVAYFYKHIAKCIKIFILIISILFTIKYFPIKDIYLGFNKLIHGNFDSWTQESRDDFQKYVKNNNLKIYFFDCHGFSLPETTYSRIIFFKYINELPKKLKENEYIAFIKYQDGEKIALERDRNGKKTKEYWDMIKYLNENYKVYKVFGNFIPSYSLESEAPAANPTIILLSFKK